MTDRTDFTKKPRTPAEKMREIEKNVDALARRVAALEEFRTHVWPGFNGPRCIPGMPAGEKIYGPLPAEPPGSPTVEEAEDVKPCARCALWQPIPDSRHHEGTCGKYGRPSIEVTKADDTCGAWRMAEPDQPRRSCWEFRDADGYVVSWMQEYAGESSHCPSSARSKHRMVELREGEGIYPQALIDSYEEMRDERYSLKASVTDLLRRREALVSEEHELKRENERLTEENRGLRTLLDEHPNQGMRQSIDRLAAERDQLQTRVVELEALLENNKALAERVAELEKRNDRVLEKAENLLFEMTNG